MFRLFATCSVALFILPGAASAQVTHPVTPAEKIQNALSAAPQDVAEEATVVDWPSPPDVDPPVLREGTNGWTCLPSVPPPESPGNDPMCIDEVFLKFRMALHRGEGVELSGVGLGYMLQGGGLLDEHGVPGLGPHTMMVLPRGGPLTESLESDPPKGTLAFSLVPGTLVVVMPVAPGGTTIP